MTEISRIGNIGSADTHKSPPAIGKPEAEAMADEWAVRRTGMSFQRTRMIADRTLMSVIRTSLSLIGFGFTVYQIFQKLHEAEVLKSSASARHFGTALLALGVLMLIVGIVY